MSRMVNPALRARARAKLAAMQANGLTANEALALANDESFMSTGGEYADAETLRQPEPLDTPTINWEEEYAERHGLPVRRVAEEVGDEDEDTTYENPVLDAIWCDIPTDNADGVAHLETPTINWEEEYNARRGRGAGRPNGVAPVGGPPTNNDAVPHLETPVIDWTAEYRARRR